MGQKTSYKAYHADAYNAVSQFTLLASTKKGNKPDFHRSASGDNARTLYKTFFTKVQQLYETEKVKDGIFQAMMDVALVNDGPVGVDYRCEDGAVKPYVHRLKAILTDYAFRSGYT